MADVVITISVDTVSYRSWLRTSYIGRSIVSDGTPMITSNELGPDQKDAFNDFLSQAANEILKIFESRQGDAVGNPFILTSTDVTYRFAEGEPVLAHAETLKTRLTEDVKDALFTYITMLWFSELGNAEQMAKLSGRFDKLSYDIMSSLYKLHD